MDLPPPVLKSSLVSINKTITKAATTVAAKSMKNAAKMEYNTAEGDDDRPRDITISCDGTWLTRGHSSTVGATTIIGMKTGKVLDTEVKSKKCKQCQYWANQDKNSVRYRAWEAGHPEHCTRNHKGSSGSMESAAARDMFLRSEQQHDLRYTKFVGDGDTNSYKSVSEAKPYGEEKPVEKLECVGHIQKRMGKRLRNLKTKLKGTKLSDGKPIGGQRRLTDAVCDKLQTYYGNAIRGNKGDLTEMRKAVWAVFFHKGSSDTKPNHHFCSVQWCPYLQAQRDDELASFTHKGNLAPAIMETIKPIFKDLADTNLLKKCLQGYTQNANESLNGTIWKYCPKTKNHGANSVKTALALATSVFNDGATCFGAILEEMDIHPGPFATAFFARRDTSRILNAQRQTKAASLEERRARRQERLAHNDNCAAKEGQPYLAGGH